MSERASESSAQRRPDLELLADLDAGVLDGDHAVRVRKAAEDDPRAAAMLAALAATRAELAALPEPPVPEHLAKRWDAALAAEPTRIPRLAARRRRLHPVLAVAAVVVAVLAAGLLWLRPVSPEAGRLPSPGQVDLVALGRAAIGVTDAGTLADPARRAGCLRAVAPPGVSPDAPLLGGRRVEIDGEQAVLLVLATGELGRFHVVVVDATCGPDGGRLVRSVPVGGR
jgi:hypothetical protein